MRKTKLINEIQKLELLRKNFFIFGFQLKVNILLTRQQNDYITYFPYVLITGIHWNPLIKVGDHSIVFMGSKLILQNKKKNLVSMILQKVSF